MALVGEYLGTGNDEGVKLGRAASDKIGFYMASSDTPVSQRAAAAQATSLVGTASSTAIDTATKAALIEVMNTLDAVNIWKGGA